MLALCLAGAVLPPHCVLAQSIFPRNCLISSKSMDLLEIYSSSKMPVAPWRNRKQAEHGEAIAIALRS